MDELKTLYFHIENPIDNKIKWNKLLNIYSTSNDYEDFYNRAIKKHKSDSSINYDIEDKKTFCLVMWSIWKNKILSISEDKIREHIDSKDFDYDIYDVIKIVRDLESVKTYTSLQQVLTNPSINRYFSDLFDDFNHKVVIYSDFKIKKDISFNTVFTIKVDAPRLYKILKNYINECLAHEIPYYVKYSEYGKKIIVNIYSTIDNFKKNESILSIIKKENYNFFSDNYDLLSGNINNAITVKNKDFFNTYQYQRERTLILFKSFDSVIYEYILNHFNTLVSFKDGRMNIIEYLSCYVMEKVVSEFVDSSIKSNQEYFLIANSEDLSNLKKYIKDKLSSSMRDILKERLYLKDDNDKITIKLNDNKTIDIKVQTFLCGIRNLTQTLISKDGSIEKAFRIRIRNECQFYKVDYDKFCLDQGFAKRLFYNKDKYESFKKEIERIHNDVTKVQSLENLISQEINQEARDKISDSMKELKEIFKIEEGS